MDDTRPVAKAATPSATQTPKQPVEHAGAQTLDSVFRNILLPLARSLNRIEKRLSTTTDGRETATEKAKLASGTSIDEKFLAVIQRRFDQLSAELNGFAATTSELIKNQSSELNVEPELLDDDSLPDNSWEQIILGDELCGNDSLAAIRSELLDEILSGNVTARAFAGQMLLLQATSIDQLPECLGSVGEAYYRWRPRTSTDRDPFERSLADLLTHRAETAGLPNSIQLVRPGDRFDISRHTSTTRGLEIVAVHGWIVLRDNQKVYTKASVSVR